MKNLLFSKSIFVSLCLIFGSAPNLFGQSTEHFAPCGSPAVKSPWLKKYQASPELYSKGGDALIYVPLSIHLLGTDEGSGYFRMEDLLAALCTLNNDFEPANLSFYIQNIDYIDNGSWFSHGDILTGAEMMFERDIPSTMNCYFVADPAGNCGYNLPYASLAVAKACAGPNDHTWAHEMGHALSLPHPFLGWEGGISHDDSMPPDFGSPAPEIVTYDYTLFQDTLILDTLIIDTAFVEKVDGSNCLVAADGFCDTAPDYIANRWECNANGVSSFTETDPNGAIFRSDGSLIMSYSDDACANRFSPDQIAAMRANLLDEHQDWLGNEAPLDEITTAVTLSSPIEGEEAQFNQVFLEWEAVPNATQYIVQISRLANFPGALTATFTAEEPGLLVQTLENNKTYYWRVMAYNNYHFCQSFSNYATFHTSNMVATNNAQSLANVRLFPTILRQGELLNLHFEDSSNAKIQFKIYNAIGGCVSQKSHERQESVKIETNLLASGIYFLQVRSGDREVTFKFVVQ